MIQAPPRTILEVFENLPEGTLAQIINNQLVMAPAPDFIHQDICGEITMQLRIFVSNHALGKVIASPIDVYFDKENVYQPDILFLANEQMQLVQQGKIKGAPQLIVEVLLPGSRRYDKGEKKEAYERFGVQEYWIVDPSAKNVTGYSLHNGRFIEMPAQPGIIESRLLQTTIRF